MFRSFAQVIDDELHPFYVERVLCVEPAGWELPFWLKRENYSVLTVHSEFPVFLFCRAFVANSKSRLSEKDWSFAPFPPDEGGNRARGAPFAPSRMAWIGACVEHSEGMKDEGRRALFVWAVDRVLAYWAHMESAGGAVPTPALVERYTQEANLRVANNRKVNASLWGDPRALAPLLPAEAVLFTVLESASKTPAYPWVARFFAPVGKTASPLRTLAQLPPLLPGLSTVPLWCAHVSGTPRTAARVEKEFVPHRKHTRHLTLYLGENGDGNYLVLGW